MSLNSPARIRANPLRGKKRTNHGGTEDTESRSSAEICTRTVFSVSSVLQRCIILFF